MATIFNKCDMQKYAYFINCNMTCLTENGENETILRSQYTGFNVIIVSFMRNVCRVIFVSFEELSGMHGKKTHFVRKLKTEHKHRRKHFEH